MAATNFTPISLYYSTTASAVPTSGNLIAGELALNTLDEKLYFKNSAGTVKLLAANITPVANGGTGLSSTPSNGQLDIGNGTGFTRATLTAGSGVTITNGSGAITINATGSGGDVVGPASATANGIALFNSTTGKLIKDSAASDGLIHGLTVGRGAGSVATTTAVGASALAANSSGGNNVAIGYQAGLVNSTGGQSTLIGSQAGLAGTDLDYVTAVGYQALSSVTSGDFNTALGAQALKSNTSASNNTAVGYQAGYSVSTSPSNTFLGYQAGYSTTNASNTHLGFQAGYSATTGTNNLTAGSYAGYSLTTGTGNTFVGGSFNFGSGYYVTTGSKNTILGSYNGNQGGLDIRTASNYIVLSDGDGNPRMYNNGTDWYDQNGKLRAVPQSGSSKTSSYTLATTDVGEYILLGASGAIVIPDATFAAGDVITIFNNTGSTATITCSITTAYIAGTFTDKATMTLAAAGVATVLFITSTLCVVSGNVT